MKKLNVGLAGYGMSGEYFHAPFIHAHDKFNLIKIVERKSEKSKRDYPYIEIVRDFSSLAKDDNLDLIIISTPNSTHLNFAKEALLAGKHVIVEKPFTPTSKEADELIEIAKKQKRILSVFQNRRWDGDFLTVKKIINSGYLGRLVEFESHYDRYRNFIKPDTWKEEKSFGHGILFDLGTHMIDQALVLFGLPESIYADIRIKRDDGKVNDAYEIILYYPSKDIPKVTLKGSLLVRELGPRYILHGTEGSFIKYGLDTQEEDLKKHISPLSENWGIEPKESWGLLNTNINDIHFEGKIETEAGCYKNYFDNIYDAIVDGKPLDVNPEEARNVIRIIELAYESSAAKKVVPFI